MSNLAVLRAAIAVSAIALVSACGGGGSGGSSGGGSGTASVPEDMDGSGDALGSYTQLSSDTGTSTLQVVGIDDSNDIDLMITIAFNHDSGTATGSPIAGVLNAARTELRDPSNNNQLVATLTNPARTEYVRFVKSEIGDDLFGVVGQVTDGHDIPTEGEATYNGVVLMTVNNGDGFYDLTGDATITARWDTGNQGGIDTLFDELSGQLPNASQGGVTGSILIRDATVSGSTGIISGGSLVRSGTIFQTDAAPSRQFSAQLFGRNADEVGGVLILEAPDLDVNAVFAAE